MYWEEVRSKYPNQFVKIQLLDSKVKKNKKVAKKVNVIHPVKNEDATKEFLRSKGNTIVYHTSKDIIEIGIRKLLN